MFWESFHKERKIETTTATYFFQHTRVLSGDSPLIIYKNSTIPPGMVL